MVKKHSQRSSSFSTTTTNTSLPEPSGSSPTLAKKAKAECVKLLTSDQAHVRLTAYRALRRTNPIGSQGTAILPYAKQLASDPDSGVRRDVALSLRDLPAAQTKAIFAILAPQVDHTDKNAIEAIGLGAANQENEIWLAIKEAMQPGEPHQWSEQFAKLTWRLWPSAAGDRAQGTSPAPLTHT